MQPRLEGLEHRVVLSTFNVNTILDTVAVNLHNGKDSSGHISLRSAIQAADARGGSNSIIVPSGTFTLTIAGAGEDASATGDLDITGNLTIKGKSSVSTIIDGNNLDRVFQILGGKVSISKVTIEHGRAVGDGGGILNSGGKVTLSSVAILNNVATGNRRRTARRALGPPARPGRMAVGVGSSMRPDLYPSPRARLRRTWPSAGTGVPVGTVGSASTARTPSAARAARAVRGVKELAVASTTRPARVFRSQARRSRATGLRGARVDWAATAPSLSVAGVAAAPTAMAVTAVIVAAEQPAPAAAVEMARGVGCLTSAPSRSVVTLAHSRPIRPTADSEATAARVATAA